MPVDPVLAPLLVNYPQVPEHIEDYDAYRAAVSEGGNALVSQVMQPPPQVGRVHDVQIPVGDGSITLRIYHPTTPGPHPIHLFFHGGGWVTGSIDDLAYDTICRERAELGGYVVVHANYRKAPEHKFPQPLEDCYAALEWVSEHAEEIDGLRETIVIGGSSAGGNLAAAVALKARDERGPALAFQLLEVPATDMTWSHPSHQEFGSGYALSNSDMEYARRDYLNSPEDALHPYVSPLRAGDLSGLPPAHVMVAEYDILRDEGAAYARRLTEAGVEATLSLQRGHVHISAVLTALMPAARQWRDEVIGVLRAQAAR